MPELITGYEGVTEVALPRKVFGKTVAVDMDFSMGLTSILVLQAAQEFYILGYLSNSLFEQLVKYSLKGTNSRMEIKSFYSSRVSWSSLRLCSCVDNVCPTSTVY